MQYASKNTKSIKIIWKVFIDNSNSSYFGLMPCNADAYLNINGIEIYRQKHFHISGINEEDTFEINLLRMDTKRRGFKDDTCYLPAQPGNCRMAIRSWYFEYNRYQLVGECKQFIYGGCRGNGNRYSSKSECERKCLQWRVHIKLMKQWNEWKQTTTSCTGQLKE